MNKGRGFTLVEIIVVIALVALLSSVVLFDGVGGRKRHTLQAAYSTLDVSLSQASLLSRAQNNNSNDHKTTHWVFDSINSRVGIYQDDEAGTGGVFDSYDVLREEYDINQDVVVQTCSSKGVGCVYATDNLIVSFDPGESERVLRLGVLEMSALYLRLSSGDSRIDSTINQLGVLSR